MAEISPLTPVNGGRAGLAAGTYNSVKLARSLRNGLEGAAKAASERQSPPPPGDTAASASLESEHRPEGAATTDQSTQASRSEPPAPSAPSRQPHPDVLLIHGEDDRTVPQCQSETMQAALGRRAKLCVLPGVDHSAYFFTMMAGGQSRVLDCVLRFCKRVESRNPEP